MSKENIIRLLIEAASLLTENNIASDSISDMVSNAQDFGLMNDDIENIELDEEEEEYE